MSVTLNNFKHTDINDELDQALEIIYDVYGCIDVVLYLINRGCGEDEDKDKLLCGACRWARLDVVKELVEEHHRNPKGEYMVCILSMCVILRCWPIMSI